MAYWYNQGAISVTQGGTTVSGTGTAFVENLRVGDGLLAPDGRLYLIQNIASDTELAIARGYVGESEVNSADWWGVPVQGYNRELADRVQQLVTSAGGALDELAPLQEAVNQLSQTVGDLDAEAVGADPEGAAAGAVEDHVAAEDPHEQYLNPQRGDQRYARLSGGAAADFTEMPQVGGTPIVESGSNSNGNYMKFSSGDLIVWDENTTGDDNPAMWTFPHEFISPARVFPAARLENSPRVSNSQAASATGTGINRWTLSLTPAGTYFYVMAIGRWK